MNKKMILIILMVFISKDVFAYKELLHEDFSIQAFKRASSNLSMMKSLGIGKQDKFLASNGKEYIPEELVGFGAIHEDSGYRSLNHFHASQYPPGNQGMLGLMPSSQQWIIDGITTLVQPPLWEQSQEYSYKMARIYHFMALLAPDESRREVWIGKLFQSLGHIIHHIQDMGQPQHVRNDIHCHADKGYLGVDLCKWAEALTLFTVDIHEPSAYEKQSMAALAGATGDLNKYLENSYSNELYAANRIFSKPGDYWENSNGTGMAEFTSKNFVSVETDFTFNSRGNYGKIGSSPGFPLPDGSSASVSFTTGEDIQNLLPNSELTGKIKFISNSIYDPLTASYVQVPRMSAFSVFNEALTKQSLQLIVTQNEFTYASRYSVLIPRLVALSSGLIDYFFRGDIEIVTEDNYYQGDKWYWKFRIRNNSDEDMDGDFYLEYDSTAINRRSSFESFEKYLSIPAGAMSQSFIVQMPQEIKTTANTILVFRGILGEETYNISSYMSSVTAPEEVPSIPCGQAISSSGGSEGYSKDIAHEMGSVAGRGVLEFDPYSIPDSIKVTAYNNSRKVLATSKGMVSGRQVISYNYNPDSLGTTKVRVEVDANSDLGTFWTFTLGCPGKSISNADRDADLVRVRMYFSSGNMGWSCSVQNFIDGKPFNMIINSELSVGWHEYSRTGSCLCELPLLCDPAPSIALGDTKYRLPAIGEVIRFEVR